MGIWLYRAADIVFFPPFIGRENMGAGASFPDAESEVKLLAVA
jgi:hypothetical protein